MVAPAPEHSTVPDLQSPVAHVNWLLVDEIEQPVLPQKRPDQPAGIFKDWVAPVWSWKPVVDSGGVPAPERIPGQTV